jgi:hypothetical protein
LLDRLVDAVAAMDEGEIENYVRKAFFPIGHRAVFSDFPSVLGNVATVIERQSRRR